LTFRLLLKVILLAYGGKNDEIVVCDMFKFKKILIYLTIFTDDKQEFSESGKK